MGETARDRDCITCFRICHQGPASSSFIPYFSAQVLAWMLRGGVRAHFSLVLSFLFFLCLCLRLSLQVEPILPNLTLFTLSALQGVPAPCWHKPRAWFDLWAGFPQLAPWECGKWFLEFLRNKLAGNLGVYSKLLETGFQEMPFSKPTWTPLWEECRRSLC